MVFVQFKTYWLQKASSGVLPLRLTVLTFLRLHSASPILRCWDGIGHPLGIAGGVWDLGDYMKHTGMRCKEYQFTFYPTIFYDPTAWVLW
ncbi:hypothetical protein ARMGADRAFT_196473 [Armillaria gallica]|uniref:Uncharacterized protein n=1 Tax=Armillaria gallica TaxID=47427 RepID=A0A2H3CL52_ARMGA|nr:hypothetical protein ARMGADRAFT_196473 [Armillaria gallica]